MVCGGGRAGPWWRRGGGGVFGGEGTNSSLASRAPPEGLWQVRELGKGA